MSEIRLDAHGVIDIASGESGGVVIDLDYDDSFIGRNKLRMTREEALMVAGKLIQWVLVGVNEDRR